MVVGYYIVRLLDLIANGIVLLVIVYVVLSYFMDIYHPVRRTIDSIVDPMLRPIRKVVPPLGGFDWSPLILIVLVQVVEWVLRAVLISLFSFI